MERTEKSFGQGTACILKVRAGIPVFIVTRCIAADNWAAGTVYEKINQSLNQSINLSIYLLILEQYWSLGTLVPEHYWSLSTLVPEHSCP
jgi:hypothetical protein